MINIVESMTTEAPLWQDLGLQERNGKIYYISVYKGRELLCDADEAEKSGEIAKFRFQSDKSQITTEELWEIDRWLTK